MGGGGQSTLNIANQWLIMSTEKVIILLLGLALLYFGIIGYLTAKIEAIPAIILILIGIYGTILSIKPR